MNGKIVHSSFLGAWLLGLFGMGVSKGVFELGPGAASFDLFSSFWIVGGVGYALFGLLAMSVASARPTEAGRER